MIAHDLEWHEQMSDERWTPSGPAGTQAVHGGFSVDPIYAYAGPVRSRRLRFGSFLSRRAVGEGEYVGHKLVDSALGAGAASLIASQAARYGLHLNPASMWLSFAGATAAGYLIMDRAPEGVRRAAHLVGERTIGRAADTLARVALRRRAMQAFASAAKDAQQQSEAQLHAWADRRMWWRDSRRASDA
jgi:hypothetical protein